MSVNLVGPIKSGVAVGGNGAATANADSTTPIEGLLLGVYIQYNDSPPATTDVTVKTKGTSPYAPSYNLLVVSNANTNGLFMVRGAVVDTAGAAIAGQHELIPIDDIVNVAIAQADAGDSVDVWLLMV